MVLNAVTYFYHFYMGRVLGPADYGILNALISITYIIYVPIYAIQMSITKFTSNFKINNEKGKISYLLTKSIKRLFFYSVIVFIVFSAFSPLIINFLKISSVVPVIITGSLLLFAFVVPVNRGVLQGLQNFKKLGLNLIGEGFAKLVLGIILVIVGFGVNGAIGAISISLIFAFVLGVYFLRDLFKVKKEKFDSKEVYKYSLPILIALTSLTLFYVVDLLLVKHYFNSVDAGYYAAIGILGKIIFFASSSISLVMFPKVSEFDFIKKDHRGILNKSLLLVILISIPVLIIYFLLPKLMVLILFGGEYVGVSSLIGWFGVFMFLFSLVYVLTFYNISINKTKFIYLLLLFNILQVVLIALFHNSLSEVIKVLILLMGGLLVILFLITKVTKDGKTFTSNTSV